MIVIEADLKDTRRQALEDVKGYDLGLPYDAIIRCHLLSVHDTERGLVKVLKNRFEGNTGVITAISYRELKNISKTP